jgi:hypothetical protein
VLVNWLMTNITCARRCNTCRVVQIVQVLLELSVSQRFGGLTIVLSISLQLSHAIQIHFRPLPEYAHGESGGLDGGLFTSSRTVQL